MIVYTFTQQTEAGVDDFITKMTPHLVPKYFSRIEKAYTTEGNEPYIQGYDNDNVLILKMRIYGSSNSDVSPGKSELPGISFYDKLNNVWILVCSLTNDSYRKSLQSVYVCTGGIYFRIRTTNSYWYPGPILCLDNMNNSTFITSSSEGSSGQHTITSQTGQLSYTLTANDTDNITGSYYLIPFFTKNGTSKRVWFPLIEQYNNINETMRIMQLDEKDYFVMPGFLIEDF